METIVAFVMPVVAFFLMIFFVFPEFLPAKRRFNNMLDDIRIYQRNYNDEKDIEFSYKGKTFQICVDKYMESCSYSRYDVYINGEKVFVYHVLEHAFSKSRERHDCGNRLNDEVDEILFAARKYVNKARYKIYDDKHTSRSYF